jgi:cation diffusion facilitator CzcD-associated flavoprotein CzcO
VALPEETDVAIIGAGFGGLGLAIRLKQAGRDDFVVLERASDVGGTWHANAYPRLPVRHPLEPLLVLVRAQVGLDHGLSAAAPALG